ncbi:RND family transporter [Alteromonas sediminis]|uniref:RND family transporter n=1 Tax=Alteromonas sediminis TaxID=2259342 RepID=A0A3N5Y458_9ALTE|nr:MMPL family transporter [Alteromonas sediminis]RPJ68240.1 RND family transporter [Alteromonas sediminis]
MLQHRPLLVLAGWTFFALLLGIGMSMLTFRGDYRVYFEDDNPQLLAFQNVQEVFSKSENVSFLVVPDSGNVFNADTFSLLIALTEGAWQTPMSSRAESLVNFQHTYAFDDDLIVEDLIEPSRMSQTDIERVKQVAMSLPEINNRLVASQGDAAVVEVTVNLPEGDHTLAVAEIAAYARELKAEMEAAHPGHTIYLSGVVMMNHAFAEEAQKDASTLVPLMFAIIAIAIVLMTRSAVASLATMIVVALSVVITMGAAGYAGLFLSTATVNVPTLVTTLAVADCMHLVVSIRQGMKQGMSLDEAIQFSLNINTKPVLITSITTAVGFLTLNFSEVPILADLGNLTALGVMLACALSLTLVPAFFRLCKVNLAGQTEQGNDFFAKLGQWVIVHYKMILPVSVLVLLISAYFVNKNELNDIVVKYFDQSSELRQAVDAQERLIGGMTNIDFVIDTQSVSGINSPDVLQDLEAFTHWLRTQPEVIHVFSMADTYKRLNKNMNNDDDSFYILPQTQEEAAQFLLLYEMSLTYGLDINNQIDIDKAATRVVATLQNLGSKEFTEFEQRAKRWFESLDTQATLSAASPPLMFAHIGEVNMRSMVNGALVALVLISAMLVFALKSWRLGVISLLPNLIPAGIGFGIWGVISGEINLALSVVLSMTLGIIVDDTVHFLSKYNVARAQNKSVEACVRYAFSTVGMALFTTTVVLASGFGVLTFSSFALNADMGLLTVIIIVAALIVDLLFLPAFLLWLDKANNQKEKSYAN